MRIGLLGPATSDVELLLDAAEFLSGDLGVDHVLYLGQDDTVDAAAHEHAKKLGGDDPKVAFLDRALEVAVDGSADDIDALLTIDAELAQLATIRALPPSPGRAIEMIDDRIVIFVFDKASLDEEDIANANVIVYGKSKEMLLKRFGRRYFFTPGPLEQRKVGVLELEDDGRVAIAAFEPSGAPLWREVLLGKGAKVTVTE